MHKLKAVFRNKNFGLVQFFLCAVFVLSQKYWCQWLSFLNLDYCWMVGADITELKRGFPKFYILVHVGNILLDFGILSLSFGFVLQKYWQPLKENAILTLSSILLTLVVAEISLRIVGWAPGQFQYSTWVKPVETLSSVYGFKADENGVFKVDTAVASVAREEVRTESLADKYLKSMVSNRNVAHELYRVFRDHSAELGKEDSDSELFRKIKHRSIGNELSEYDSLIDVYTRNPINDDGFYSIPFINSSSALPKVLLLGDSFTWGHSSSNKTLSFANTLLARDFLVFNTGISGADVAQYRRLMELHMEKLLPDIVVLNFYMGNDVEYFQRTPKSGLPIHFSTNAGNLLAFQAGVQHETKEDAYSSIMSNMMIPRTTRLNRIMSQTVISTLIWTGLERLGVITHEYFGGLQRPKRPECNYDIIWMENYCASRNIPFILSVIPKLKGGKLEGPENVENLFDSITHHQPNMTVSMYNAKEGHFNDAGHLFYANYLQVLIDNKLSDSNGSIKADD
ncbi:MAG: hypothetical protein ACI9EQ_001580 [Bacteroidia bacterium]|jgi:hypothetical protein